MRGALTSARLHQVLLPRQHHRPLHLGRRHALVGDEAVRVHNRTEADEDVERPERAPTGAADEEKPIPGAAIAISRISFRRCVRAVCVSSAASAVDAPRAGNAALQTAANGSNAQSYTSSEPYQSHHGASVRREREGSMWCARGPARTRMREREVWKKCGRSASAVLMRIPRDVKLPIWKVVGGPSASLRPRSTTCEARKRRGVSTPQQSARASVCRCPVRVWSAEYVRVRERERESTQSVCTQKHTRVGAHIRATRLPSALLDTDIRRPLAAAARLIFRPLSGGRAMLEAIRKVHRQLLAERAAAGRQDGVGALCARTMGEGAPRGVTLSGAGAHT
eukprot:2092692-Prymnesium_polylepis.2